MAAGRALRTSVPRRAQGTWESANDRPDPVAILEAQEADRVPELLPIRYGRMAASPFGFLRGAAAVMASDLARTPVSGIDVQLCGDAHIANFGLFATPERNLVFDVNDFDETLRGPWEWDVKRLATSLVVAARARGDNPAGQASAVATAAASYRSWVGHYATERTLDVWYSRVDAGAVKRLLDTGLRRRARAQADAAIAHLRTESAIQAVSKLTIAVDGRRRIRDRPPLVEHVAGEDQLPRMRELLAAYRSSLRGDVRRLVDRFSLRDAARKVVGVGSVGTRCWVVLFEGGAVDDPLLLQVKQADSSVLETHLPPSTYGNHGRRVVEGQRLVQAASDVYLGWAHDPVEGFDYYWRQLQDMKGSPDLMRMGARAYLAYAALCGWVLARAHARSGDAAAIAGYLGTGAFFDRALTSFARAYADQTERDHAALLEAIRSGRVKAEQGAATAAVG